MLNKILDFLNKHRMRNTINLKRTNPTGSFPGEMRQSCQLPFPIFPLVVVSRHRSTTSEAFLADVVNEFFPSSLLANADGYEGDLRKRFDARSAPILARKAVISFIQG